MASTIMKFGGELSLEAKCLFGSIFLALLGANLLGSTHHNIVEELHLHFLVNDVAMAMFFLVVAIEVRLDLLPGGLLNPVKKAIVPLAATIGGVIGPSTVFAVAAVIFINETMKGAAIPTATDIAVSVVVLRTIFAPHHPAETFLKVLAIADDVLGIVIIAVAFPEGSLVSKLWLVLPAVSVVVVYGLHRWSNIRNWYWYVPFALLSWVGFHEAHVHAALALVPLAFVAPHPLTDVDTFDDFELPIHGSGKDALSQMLDGTRYIIPAILFLFGFTNLGIRIDGESFGWVTFWVLIALVVGKPVGILASTWLITRFKGVDLDPRIGFKHVYVLGQTAGIGLTVALFVSTVVYNPAQPQLAQASVGALLSFPVSAVLSITASRMWKLPRRIEASVYEEEELVAAVA